MDVPLALVNGGYTLITIDAETYPDIIRRQWKRNRQGYAYEPATGRLLHREVTGAPKGMHVHHENELKLDNRLQNLRILTPEEHKALHPHAAAWGKQRRRKPPRHKGTPGPAIKIDLLLAWREHQRPKGRHIPDWYERGWRQDEQGRWKIDKKEHKRFLERERQR